MKFLHVLVPTKQFSQQFWGYTGFRDNWHVVYHKGWHIPAKSECLKSNDEIMEWICEGKVVKFKERYENPQDVFDSASGTSTSN